jgi:hypothetical protein
MRYIGNGSSSGRESSKERRKLHRVYWYRSSVIRKKKTVLQTLDLTRTLTGTIRGHLVMVIPWRKKNEGNQRSNVRLGQFPIMIVQTKNPREVNLKEMLPKWDGIMDRVIMFIQDLRNALGPKDFERPWGRVRLCNQAMFWPDRLIDQSNVRRGCVRNPTPAMRNLFEKLQDPEESWTELYLDRLRLLSDEMHVFVEE